MQLTRHDGPGVIVGKRAAHLLARITTRVLEQPVYEQDTLTADLPDVDPAKLTHLEDDGVARIGTEISSGMVLVGRLVPRRGQPEPEAEAGAVDRAFGVPEGRDGSLRCPHGVFGVIDSITMEDGAKKGDPRVIKVSILSEYPLRLGGRPRSFDFATNSVTDLKSATNGLHCSPSSAAFSLAESGVPPIAIIDTRAS